MRATCPTSPPSPTLNPRYPYPYLPLTPTWLQGHVGCLPVTTHEEGSLEAYEEACDDEEDGKSYQDCHTAYMMYSDYMAVTWRHRVTIGAQTI